LYCAVTTYNPQGNWWIQACAGSKAEAEIAAREAIGPLMRPGEMSPDIYRETAHINLLVLPRSKLIRKFGRWRFEDMLDRYLDELERLEREEAGDEE
jgi:hypothetical protein